MGDYCYCWYAVYRPCPLFDFWQGGCVVAILTLEKVSKSFGTNKLLDDLSFSVEEQTIFGFIGKNGAGKTTTMKLILGLIKKTAERSE